jgi:Holliday junction resolvasome RuvABC endonuclease subunit
VTLVLGVDPGATTGWCVYDDYTRCVVESGTFQGDAIDSSDAWSWTWKVGSIVIERPVAHGPTRPQVVECARTEGILFATLRREGLRVLELTRLQVKQALTIATHGEVQVRNDATAWAALKLLHGGDGCDKRGGALHGVKAHGRAALAVAVALLLMTPKSVGAAP